MDLTTIPRYADFNGHRINKVELDYVEIAYNSTKTLVAAEYSLNGASWRNLNIISGTWNQSNNTVVYKVDGLTPGSNYSIETRIAHVDSVWRNSGQLSFRTKEIAKITKIENIDFGKDININFANLENGTSELIVKAGNIEICRRNDLTATYILSFTKNELSQLINFLNNETIEITCIVITNNKYSFSTKCVITLKSNIYVKKEGIWIKAKVYKKNKTWKQTRIFFKENGAWRNTK